MPKEPTKRPLETPRILSDSPLWRKDDKAHFHFDQFAATLARLIADKTTLTPLTIGVSGAWGSGKTTLLRRLENMLKETSVLFDDEKPAAFSFANGNEETQKEFRACRAVWFNAWKYADEEKILIALIRVIVQEMFRDDFISKNAAALFEPFTDRRDVIGTVLGWFSIKVGNAQIGFNTGEAKQTVFTEKIALLDQFDDVFDKLLIAWTNHSLTAREINPHKGILVVFIDDLDRCLPAKAVQVLEAIKLFMDKEGCVFVLGADTEIVREAVESYYQNAKVTGQNAADYLDKIVQLRFDLPPVVAATMQEYLKTQNVGAEMLAQWQTLIAAAAINPRRVKLVFNEIELQWKMLVNSGQADGIQREDFIRWSALWRAAPEIYREKVRDFDDLDFRLKFVSDSLAWGIGQLDDSKKSAFADYEKKDGRRLRNVLREIKTFSAEFDAKTLDAFMHLSAPPQKIVSLEPEKPAVTIQAKSIKSAEEVGHPEIYETPPVHFGIEPELEEIAKGPVTRGEKSPSTVHRPPSSDAKRMTIGGIEFVKIPAGKFIMGSKDDNPLAANNEKPQHTVEIAQDYWMARFPVTNEQYRDFMQEKADVDPVSNWQKMKNHPVTKVSWKDALAYCEWFNGQYRSDLGNLILRLPTEAEWEKAARGEYGNEWPWGNEFDPTRCNSGEGKKGDTTPVTAYPQGASPYGAEDMVGNVWEWTHSQLKPYPYQAQDGREDAKASSLPRVVRGGAFLDNRQFVRCACRRDLGNLDFNVGFRVVAAPMLS